jgi:DegV family protein with EDD domain
MSKVAVVTDSTNCLPAELIKKHNIQVVPYRVVIDGKDYRDQIDITPTEFYRIFLTLKRLPTTGTPSPGDYVNTFTELAKSTDSIVCLIVSKALSANYKSVEEAKDIVITEHPDLKIEILDSKNSVGALGFLALEAARAADKGSNLPEVVKVVQDLVPRVKYVAAFDTLKYLIKGGRAPKTAIIGEFLQVKPIIGLINDTGMVVSLGKTRGKQNALIKLADLVQDHADVSKPLHFIAHYSAHVEDAERLKELVTARYNCAEAYVTELTPVMATHTGPSVGLSFYS